MKQNILMKTVDQCPLCNSMESVEFLSARDYFLSGEEFSIRECGSCLFRFTSPLPPVESIGRYYKSENYISHTDSRKGILNKLYHLVKQRALFAKYTLIKNKTDGNVLLDIGCGSGAFPAYMADKGFYVTSIEPDKEARTFAIKNYGVDVRPEHEINSLTDGAYDVISMWHVLEHVYTLHERMEQIKRLSAEGGLIIIALPNCESYDAIYYGPFWAAYDLPRHLYHFTSASMTLLASKHGFRISEILPMKYDAYYVSLLSEKYKGGNWVSAFFTGMKSNLHARKNPLRYSSLIYVLKKE